MTHPSGQKGKNRTKGQHGTTKKGENNNGEEDAKERDGDIHYHRVSSNVLEMHWCARPLGRWPLLFAHLSSPRCVAGFDSSTLANND